MKTLKSLLIVLFFLPSVVLAGKLTELDLKCKKVYYHAQAAVAEVCQTFDNNTLYQNIHLVGAANVNSFRSTFDMIYFKCAIIVQNPFVSTNIVGYNGCELKGTGQEYSQVTLYQSG